MEISIAAFLLCLTLFFHLQEMKKDQKIYLAPLFGALSFMARPELILLYPLLLIHYYAMMRKDMNEKGGQSIKATVFIRLLNFIVFLCPYFIISYAFSGSILPNTLVAKTLDSGIIWAIKNGNLNELFISLTLNPFIWGGTMLVVLVSLNIIWSFIWSKGLVLSFMKKDTFIYPLIFLFIPVARGVVAPVGNAFSADHRYVSFLFPLLSIIFVIGWRRLEQKTKATKVYVSFKRWLNYLIGAFLILAIIFYLNPLVRKYVFLRFFTEYYFPSIHAKTSYFNFSNFKVILSFALIFITGVYLLGTTKLSAKLQRNKEIVVALFLMAGITLQIGFLINWTQRYALAVRNINQMQVYLGKWMNQNIPERSLVAIHDVGAIKFFGNRDCLDLEGLVSPQIIPYKIMGSDSYIVYLNEHRPDYFIIFAAYYPVLAKALGLEQEILHRTVLERDIASGGGGVMIAAKPNWERFDSIFQKTGLLEIKPYIPKKSLKRRWYDAQERQGLFPDWRVYQLKGREAERKQSLAEAEKYYQKAEDYDPQHDEFYLQMASFYRNKGNNMRAELEIEKALKFQLFPPPDLVPEK